MTIKKRAASRDLVLVTLLWVVVSLVSGVASALQGDHAGTIRGQVITRRGLPIARARVYLRAPGFTIGAGRRTKTDAKGRFAFHDVPWGTYDVFSDKPSGGYPDIAFAFYAHRKKPLRVSVSPSSPSAYVRVRIGPPCGKLFVSAKDAITGHTIKPVVTLRPVAAPRKYLVINIFSGPILIPSDVRVRIKVSATGYQSWPGQESESGKRVLILKPLQSYTLEVRMLPLRSPSAK